MFPEMGRAIDVREPLSVSSTPASASLSTVQQPQRSERHLGNYGLGVNPTTLRSGQLPLTQVQPRTATLRPQDPGRETSKPPDPTDPDDGLI